MLRGLYVVTDETLTPADTMMIRVESALRGGAAIVQLRDKTLPRATTLARACELAALCRRYDALLIVNDDPLIAREADAHGVHIGRDDADIAAVRAVVGDRIVGVSCYGDLDRALAMQEAGADYVAFGAFFPSGTKPAAPTVPLDVLTRAKERLSLPICAIGGITLRQAAGLIDAGADMTAVIGDIWNAPDIQDRCQSYGHLFERRER